MTLSVSAEGTQSKEYQFGITLNNSIIESSVSSRVQAVLGNIIFSSTCMFCFNDGDKLRAVVKNITDNSNITVQYANIVIVEV